MLNVVDAYTYIIKLVDNIPTTTDRQKAMILKAILVRRKQLLLSYHAEAMQENPVIIIQPPIKMPIKLTALLIVLVPTYTQRIPIHS